MTPEQRSRCMSRVKSKNTKPERLLRKELWRLGLRYRLKNDLPGKPDIVFPGKKLAIFVDGCFWHGCPEHGEIPKTNKEIWKKKINRNIERDSENKNALISDGWTVLRVWEHELNEDLNSVAMHIRECLSEITTH
ncbi:MAG: very short patch repair endonuclease [Candidatus Thiodiazotropha sp.]